MKLAYASAVLSAALMVAIASSALAQTTKPAPSRKAPVSPSTRKAAPPAAAETAPPAPVHPAPPPKPTAVKIRTRYTAQAQVSENTTYFSGARQRFEFPGLATITQCDTRKTVQVNDRARRYLVQASADAATGLDPQATGAATAIPVPQASKGGVIAYTITTTDTGERKELFGREARHLTIVTLKQPSADACDRRAESISVDGWYIDLPEAVVSCPLTPAAPPPPAAAGCTDRIDSKQVGNLTPGFAVATTVTTVQSDAQDDRKADKSAQGRDTSVTSMEVVDLALAAVETTLFDVPADYTEVHSIAELLAGGPGGRPDAVAGSLADALLGSLAEGTRTVALKRPGDIRIGIAGPANTSGRDLSASAAQAQLMGPLNRVPYEAVPISGETPADLERDARAKQCDYVLTTDLAELRSSKPGKAGGLLKKISGDQAPSAEVHEARVEYRLYAIGKTDKPLVASSAKASSGGGFGVGSALKLAAFAGQMYVGTMTGMMGVGGVGGLARLNLAMGGGGGLTNLVMGPGMGSAMSLMSQAGLPGVPDMDENHAAALRTAGDAFGKAGSAVSDELRKKTPTN